MDDPRQLSGKAAIAGVGLSRFGRVPGTSAMGFALEASASAIADSGIAKSEIDGVLVLMPAQMGEQHGWASRVAVHLGLAPAFCSTMDMGGASAIGMMQTAAALVHAGVCKAVLCAFGSQTNPQGILPTMFGSQFAIPYGDVGAMPFMAHVGRRQMHEIGITSEQYGAIAVAFRKHASRNPLAQKRDPMTLADHQASRWIVEPLHLLDCCLVTDGGGAIVVTSTERARDLRHGAAKLAGFGQVHSSEIVHPDRHEAGIGGGREAGDQAWRMAGLGPADVDVVQLYDGFTPLVVHSLIVYGFCRPDEVGAFVSAGELEFDRGRLPTNTAGGLLSEGHLSGFNHVVEAVRQLRGTSTSQVPDVEVSMVTGYGGAPHEAPPTVAYTVAILTR
ncbi:thiolase family protein [bacterium]|nr:thiolase family protein [bacterium]